MATVQQFSSPNGFKGIWVGRKIIFNKLNYLKMARCPEPPSLHESLRPNNFKKKIKNIIAVKKCLSGFNNTIRSLQSYPNMYCTPYYKYVCKYVQSKRCSRVFTWCVFLGKQLAQVTGIQVFL